MCFDVFVHVFSVCKIIVSSLPLLQCVLHTFFLKRDSCMHFVFPIVRHVSLCSFVSFGLFVYWLGGGVFGFYSKCQA